MTWGARCNPTSCPAEIAAIADLGWAFDPGRHYSMSSNDQQGSSWEKLLLHAKFMLYGGGPWDFWRTQPQLIFLMLCFQKSISDKKVQSLACSCLVTRGRRCLHCRSRSTKSSEVPPFLPLGAVRENVLLKPLNQKTGWLMSSVYCRFGGRKSQVVEKASSWSQAFSLFDRQASDVISCLSSMLACRCVSCVSRDSIWSHVVPRQNIGQRNVPYLLLRFQCNDSGWQQCFPAAWAEHYGPRLQSKLESWSTEYCNVCLLLAPVFIFLLAMGKGLDRNGDMDSCLAGKWVSSGSIPW